MEKDISEITNFAFATVTCKGDPVLLTTHTCRTRLGFPGMYDDRTFFPIRSTMLITLLISQFA